MAKEQVTVLRDDIDDTQDKTVETLSLWNPLTGDPLEIELHKKHRAELESLVKPLGKFIDAAHRPPTSATTVKRGANGRAGRPRVSGGRTSQREQNQAIRDWATAQGLPVSARGRISVDVMKAFHEAH